MKTLYNFFVYLVWFSKYFDQKQCAVRILNELYAPGRNVSK